MQKSSLQEILEYLEHSHDIRVINYKGRFMNGRSCIAILASKSINLFQFGVLVGRRARDLGMDPKFDGIDVSEEYHIRQNVHQDYFDDLHNVFYWPDVQYVESEEYLYDDE
jgi:hypothetical protein